MNVRRRSGLMNKTVGSAPRNAVTSRQDSESQVKPIKNSVSKPKATGYGRVKNAVNG